MLRIVDWRKCADRRAPNGSDCKVKEGRREERRKIVLAMGSISFTVWPQESEGATSECTPNDLQT